MMKGGASILNQLILHTQKTTFLLTTFFSLPFTAIFFSTSYFTFSNSKKIILLVLRFKGNAIKFTGTHTIVFIAAIFEFLVHSAFHPVHFLVSSISLSFLFFLPMAFSIHLLFAFYGVIDFPNHY